MRVRTTARRAKNASTAESSSGSPLLQRKTLAVSAPGDRFEQEADRVAEDVMRMPLSPRVPSQGREQISRACASGECTCPACDEEKRLRSKLGAPAIPESVQRQEEEEEDEELLQTKPASGGARALSPEVRSQIDSVRGTGRPLPESERAFFEPRFGHDFGKVRIHADAKAAEAARAVNARAFTIGRDIFFAAGQYAPRADSGKRLLAHELTHVVQQNSGPELIARQACAHDGKATRCGAGGLGRWRLEKPVKLPGLTTATPALDHLIIINAAKRFGGVWLTQVQAPPNRLKSGKDRGFVDGMKISLGANFKGEVVEVKARSLLGGGCERAAQEAKQYVNDLKAISPKIGAVSRAAHKVGGLNPRHPRKERAALREQGIDLGRGDDAHAWSFYYSVQKKLPALPKRNYSAFSFTTNADGSNKKSYKAASVPIVCKRNRKPGIRFLSYQVNQKGGISYGCKDDCGKRRRRRKRAAKSRQKGASSGAHQVGIDPSFKIVLRETRLHRDLRLPPDRIAAMTLAESTYRGIVDVLAFQRALQNVKQNQPLFRGSALQQGILGSTVISGVTAVGLAAAVTISTGVGIAGAVGGATVAATGTAAGATGTAAGAATTATLTTLPWLSTVAANTNALQVAAAIALFIGSKAVTESRAQSAIKSAFTNKEYTAAFDVASSPVPIRPGLPVTVNGKPHRVVWVG